ncbi:hypothetical protein NNC19_13570 [Clostridium sp. SHJSY1]|uniref:hypothetical protein n=1 Tax=Clostridium sp. SHJSY1 TaxID=2942483 RepID=UPI002875F489|nr:hypothetical protein [Clostridium sp. SHJSY1]MDS0526715.1 hypothetical protein [Clostridium sp. SHJSY1]
MYLNLILGAIVSIDCLWIYIKAKAIDYEINEKTGKLIEGSNTSKVKFKEFWRFVRKNDKWVADEIKQLKDINTLDFFTIKVRDKNGEC